MFKDTIITIGRRVLPAQDSAFVTLELSPLKAIELPGCELNLSEVILPHQKVELPPEINTYFCKQDTVIMISENLPVYEVTAYPIDGMLHDVATVSLVVFTLWYISGSINKWSHLFKEIRKCIFVA